MAYLPLLVTVLSLAAVLVPAAAAQVDTTVGIERLRADARAHPDSFPLVFALGRALARGATELEKDWPQRQEARKVLDHAFRLRPNDPRPFLEIGLLLRKQGLRQDATRVLQRAEERAAAADAALDPGDAAEIHYQLALIHEVWWEDAEHLGLLSADFTRSSCPGLVWLNEASQPAPPTSPRANLLAYNVICPTVFDEVMQYWVPLNAGEADYVTMVEHFRAALRLDPTRTDAAVRLLRHLASAGRWEEYLAVAEPLARRLPNDPHVLLFLGLAYHATGLAERADSVLSLALERADSVTRDHWLAPAQLLRTNDSVTFGRLSEDRRVVLGDLFWRSRDPLFLTAQNERLAEHLARIAYVEVAYGTPQSGVRGRWTDRGAAWLRYGRPLQIRVIRGGTELIEFWDYGAGTPDLVFVRQRTYRYARYEEYAERYARHARERVPELYAPAHPRIIARIPFQAAAFRAEDGESVLEVYAALPGTALREAAHLADFDAAAFVVTADLWEPRGARRERRAMGSADTLLDAAFPLAPGRYIVSVEAAAGDVAAQRRYQVDVPRFRDSLMLSDLLLVDRFGAEQEQVDARADLAPVVSRTRVFPAGQPIGVLWEIYGLQTDSGGVARFAVRAEVADTSQANTVLQLLRERAGQEPRPTRVEWEASRVPRADGAVVEHVMVNLPDAKPEAYRIFITVADRLAGRSYTVHAPFAIAEPKSR